MRASRITELTIACTASIITLSVLGALLMYVLAMASLFRLRKSEPELARPFRMPLFPVLPAASLAAAVVCFASVVWTAHETAVVFALLLLAGAAMRVRPRDRRV